MKNQRSKYNGYSHEFRGRAIDLAQEIGITTTAEKLGVSPQRLQNWVRRDAMGIPMRGKKKNTEKDKAAALAEAELKKLRRENEELKKANWILREVAKVFSEDPLDSDLRRSLNSPAKGQKK